MKLTNLKKIIEKIPKLKTNLSEASLAYETNPENQILQKKCP